MGYYVWMGVNRSQRYETMLANDPNVPANYVLTSGSDRGTDEHQQQFQAGVNNQGAGSGTYTDGDPQQRVDQPAWPNGILGNFSGNRTHV